MKKGQFTYLILCCMLTLLVACKESNITETIPIQLPKVGTPEYYANLRAYKRSKHQIAFGWFGNSGGDGKTASMGLRWETIPDSTDIVSCWGGFPVANSPQFEAMQKARKERGIKAVLVEFSNDAFFKRYAGEDFVEKYTKGNKELLYQGFEVVAKALAEAVEKNQADGVDLDHEPNVCGCDDWKITKDRTDFSKLLIILGKYFGPKSGTNKLLMVDGEYEEVNEEAGPYLDYLITQSYSTSNPATLQGRYNSVAAWFPSEKFIVTESFEAYWQTGGVTYTDPVRGKMPSILGMAYWNPQQGAKGGAGAYHAQYDYNNPKPYGYFRQMIQIMNPAVR